MSDVITTKRLVLRPPVEADGAVVMVAFSDYEIVKWLARPPYPFTRTDLRLKNLDGSSRWPDLAVIEHAGQMIGMVSGVPHLGFYLLRSAWGQGYATEAARAMASRVFRETDAGYIASGYFEGNEPSANVLAKTGFQEAGHGEKWCNPRGKHLPFVDMRLDRKDWEARQ